MSLGLSKQQFRSSIANLMQKDKPVQVHVGCGLNILPDFLNVQIRPYPKNNKRDFFAFDATHRWPCPDECVDFVFHEDFLEHLDQHEQFMFFAETFRVMKPGSTQYVSVPSIEWIMRERSDFQKGCIGVYDEWSKWRHKLLHSHATLRDMVELVGFRYNHSDRHPLAVRPAEDRDRDKGNIFAELVKPSALRLP